MDIQPTDLQRALGDGDIQLHPAAVGEVDRVLLAGIGRRQ
jgi:hypothetical protein